jgi:hypothetical protein
MKPLLLPMPLSDPPAISRMGETAASLLVVMCAVFAVGLSLVTKFRIARSQGKLRDKGLARTGFWLGILPSIFAIVLMIVSVFGGAGR